MPNTLVHFAAQGAASRALWRRLDPRFLYLGCVLPDLPWILRRAVVAFGVPVDAFDLRLYTMGLASLAITLLLAAAVAVATTAPRRVFAWLGLNALLHLLLDATEIKFGNGVHLLAPFSWRMTSFELLPGESPVYVLLTIAGVLLVLWDIARRRDGAVGWERRPRSWAVAAALARGLPRRAAAVSLRDRGFRQLFGEDAARERTSAAAAASASTACTSPRARPAASSSSGPESACAPRACCRTTTRRCRSTARSWRRTCCGRTCSSSSAGTGTGPATWAWACWRSCSCAG